MNGQKKRYNSWEQRRHGRLGRYDSSLDTPISFCLCYIVAHHGMEMSEA
jgi:hypothetical protein